MREFSGVSFEGCRIKENSHAATYCRNAMCNTSTHQQVSLGPLICTLQKNKKKKNKTILKSP